MVPGLRCLQCASHRGPAWRASLLCDRSERVPSSSNQDDLGSWQCCRCWPRHGMGLGKAHPTGLAAAAPSSLGSHLQVPHVQSSQGPAGEGQSHTCSAKRASGLLVELRTPLHPASWLQPKATVKAALVRACPSQGHRQDHQPLSPSRPIFLFKDSDSVPYWNYSVETKLYVPPQYLCHQLPPGMPSAQSWAAATWELQVDVGKGPPG